MKKKKKIWVLINSAKRENQYLFYQKEVKVIPNFFLVKTRSITLLTTDKVDKNFTKLTTSKGKTFYLDMSLCKSAEYIGTDLIQVNKSCFVSLSKIEKRLGFKYVFVKNIKKPIKVGKIFAEILKSKLYQ